MSEKIIDRIRKLVAKQESSNELGNLEEANAFALKVSELLTKHNLSMLDIGEKPKTNTVNKVKLPHITPKKNEGDWIFDLYNVICQFNYGKLIINTNSLKVKTAVIIAENDDMDVIIYLGAQIESKIRFAFTQIYKEYKGSIKKNKFKRDFLTGAVTGLYTKFTKLREYQQSMDQRVTSLVISKNDKIQKFVEDEFKNLKESRKKKLNHNAAMELGYKVGSELDLNKGLQGEHLKAKKLQMG